MKCYVVTCEIIQGLFVYSAGVNRGRITPSVLSFTGATSDDTGWTEGSIGAENIARSINEGDPDVRGFAPSARIPRLGTPRATFMRNPLGPATRCVLGLPILNHLGRFTRSLATLIPDHGDTPAHMRVVL
jgi:hypothetical protein